VLPGVTTRTIGQKEVALSNAPARNGSEHQNVDERLEVAFRNADVVAWKNQNRGVKGVDLFHAGT
jgi:hypothetical protein